MKLFVAVAASLMAADAATTYCQGTETPKSLGCNALSTEECSGNGAYTHLGGGTNVYAQCGPSGRNCLTVGPMCELALKRCPKEGEGKVAIGTDSGTVDAYCKDGWLKILQWSPPGFIPTTEAAGDIAQKAIRGTDFAKLSDDVIKAYTNSESVVYRFEKISFDDSVNFVMKMKPPADGVWDAMHNDFGFRPAAEMCSAVSTDCTLGPWSGTGGNVLDTIGYYSNGGNAGDGGSRTGIVLSKHYRDLNLGGKANWASGYQLASRSSDGGAVWVQTA